MCRPPKNINIFTIGLGSNIIIRDGGIPGVVIKLNNGFNKIEILNDEKIIVGCGLKNMNLVKFCLENNYGGFEFLSGIPGSIGGSIKMNAGCFQNSISDTLIEIKAINRNGDIVKVNKKEIIFDYRYSSISDDWIIIEASFKIFKKNSIKLKKIINKLSDERKKTQPINTRTGGSTFKNPKSLKAWKLIDDANYRGKKIGGAEVSEKHSNFIINNGNATSLDLELLGEKIIKKVYKNSQVKLKWEIKRVGKFKRI